MAKINPLWDIPYYAAIVVCLGVALTGFHFLLLRTNRTYFRLFVPFYKWFRKYWAAYKLRRARLRAQKLAKAEQAKYDKRIQDRLAAYTHLHTALQYTDNLDLNHGLLTHELWRPIIAATKHVTEARERFPDITVEYTNKKGETRNYTIDDISEHLLWIEAVLKSHHHYVDSGWKEGLIAIDKAIGYAPNVPTYYSRKAILHTRLKQRRKALAAISQALKINPMDFEALQIKDRMEADPLIGARDSLAPGASTVFLISMVMIVAGIILSYTQGGGPYPLLFIVGIPMFFLARRRMDRNMIAGMMEAEHRRAGLKGPHDL